MAIPIPNERLNLIWPNLHPFGRFMTPTRSERLDALDALEHPIGMIQPEVIIVNNNNIEMDKKHPHTCQKCGSNLKYYEVFGHMFGIEWRESEQYKIFNIHRDILARFQAGSLVAAQKRKAIKDNGIEKEEDMFKIQYKKKFNKLWSEGIMQWVCCNCFMLITARKEMRNKLLTNLEYTKEMSKEVDQHAMQDAIMILEREFEKILF